MLESCTKPISTMCSLFLFYLVNQWMAGCLYAQNLQDTPLPQATFQEAGMDSMVIQAMLSVIPPEKEHKLHSILVMRKGKMVWEKYFHHYTRDKVHDIRSATKSITSLLIGIAVDQGKIRSIEDAMMPYLREKYPDIEDKDAITLRHLLTMTTGLDCDDQDKTTKGQEDKMYRSKDWVRYFLHLDRRYPVGDTSLYCTGGVVVLGEVLEAASEQSAEQFADQHLFSLLGIHNYHWSKFYKKQKIDTGGHLYITPQGMAKIGLLVLQHGTWQGIQVLSNDWISLSTQQQVVQKGQPYGLLWWLYELPYHDKKVKVIAAHGNGGQVIFIVPALELVTVFTAGYYNSDKASIPFHLFIKFILPSVR